MSRTGHSDAHNRTITRDEAHQRMGYRLILGSRKVFVQRHSPDRKLRHDCHHPEQEKVS